MRAAVDRAVDQFRSDLTVRDRELAWFLLDQAPVLDLPTVAQALRDLVLHPAKSGDGARTAFVQAVKRFGPGVPEHRLDWALERLVQCLRDELQDLPELRA